MLGKTRWGEDLSHNMQLAHDSIRTMHLQAITVKSFSNVNWYRYLVEYWIKFLLGRSMRKEQIALISCFTVDQWWFASYSLKAEKLDNWYQMLAIWIFLWDSFSIERWSSERQVGSDISAVLMQGRYFWARIIDEPRTDVIDSFIVISNPHHNLNPQAS